MSDYLSVEDMEPKSEVIDLDSQLAEPDANAINHHDHVPVIGDCSSIDESSPEAGDTNVDHGMSEVSSLPSLFSYYQLNLQNLTFSPFLRPKKPKTQKANLKSFTFAL